MTQDVLDPEIVPRQRPTFLKVLCILTFIGSGYNIVNSTVTYFKAESISALVTEAKTQVNEDLKKEKKDKEESAFVGQIMGNMSDISTPENLRKASIGNIITSVICLLGAILMWNLRRSGFYIYTLGTIIGIILPFYMFGSNLVTNISAGFMGFIGILFVIFYAMNLKSMK